MIRSDKQHLFPERERREGGGGGVKREREEEGERAGWEAAREREKLLRNL